MTNGAGRGDEPLRIKVALADLDGSAILRRSSPALRPTRT
jgi:hypothetical protein